ncbi:MAG TPA: hypothetical protein PLD59_06270, partial [Tepidisphaeraceae bacterium]|nr:hypothetical protein [Tepidisphaeraceae bacterium]
MSFSGDGITSIDLAGVSNESVNAAVVLTDGRVVLAGRATVGSETDFFVARLLANGSLDTSFAGGAGFVAIDFQVNDEAMDLAIDSSNRIVVAGTSSSGAGSNARKFAVARVNSNGTLDGTFSGDGKTLIDWGINADAQAVAIDGSLIYVGGYKDLGSSGQFALARLLSNGSLDTSYSGDGMVFFGFSGGADSRCYDIAPLGSGRVVMVGYDQSVGSSTGRNFAYAVLGANAVLDSSFSGDGIAVTDFSSGADDEARSVGIDYAGRIVVAGFTDGTGGDDFAATRLTATGSLDSSFNADGRFSINLGGVEQADGLVVHPDGDITLSGGTSTGGFQAALVRVSGNTGNLSTTFGDGGDGIQLVNFGAIEDGFALALDPRDYRAVFAGNDGAGRLAVGRIHDLRDLNYNGAATGKMVMQADGKILVLRSNVLERLHTNGSRDTTFGIAGVVTLPAGNDSYADLAVDSLGRIVIVGAREGTGVLVRRLLPSGATDTGFSGDGVTTIGFGVGTDFDRAEGVAIDASDRIVIVGEDWSTGGILANTAVARLTTTGLLDTTFDGDGKATFDFSPIPFGSGGDLANAVQIQQDGKIVMVGQVQVTLGATFDWLVARLNANGSRDNTFGTLGLRTVNAGGTDDEATDLAIDSSGRIYVVGLTDDLLTADNATATIMAFDEFGNFDNAFAGDGRRTLNLPDSAFLHSVEVQPDGKPVAVGRVKQGSVFHNLVYRFTTGGSDDNTFAGDGQYIFPLVGSGTVGKGVIADGGAIYFAGGAVNRLNVQPAAVDGELLFETSPQRLRVSFNEDIGDSLGDFDFSIRNVTSNTLLPTSTYVLQPFVSGANQATINFNGILGDGNYEATFSSTGIRNRQNMTLGGDRVKEFFFLNGDANRDRTVSLNDFTILAANFGQTGRVFSQGNFNYSIDGAVSLDDFTILASQFGKSLPATADLPR